MKYRIIKETITNKAGTVFTTYEPQARWLFFWGGWLKNIRNCGDGRIRGTAVKFNTIEEAEHYILTECRSKIRTSSKEIVKVLECR